MSDYELIMIVLYLCWNCRLPPFVALQFGRELEGETDFFRA